MSVRHAIGLRTRVGVSFAHRSCVAEDSAWHQAADQRPARQEADAPPIGSSRFGCVLLRPDPPLANMSTDPAPLRGCLDPALHAHHAAHPDGPCGSMQCLRQHCAQIAANNAASIPPSGAVPVAAAASSAAAAPDSAEWSDSTTSFEGSPHSTRSGTSPGYANDWSLRPERLDRITDKPSRGRRDREVRRLASAKLGESAATPSQPQASLATSAAAPIAAACLSRPMPPAAAESASGATPLLQPVGGTSLLLQRRQQRKKSESDAVAQS